MKFFGRKQKNLSLHEQKELDDRLCKAAEFGRTEEVQKLLAAGADVHAMNDWALCLTAYWGYTDTVQILAEHIFAPDPWRGKSRAEIEAEARVLYRKIQAFGVGPERLLKAAKIIADCGLDRWHQVRPVPPKYRISPLPAQPRPL